MHWRTLVARALSKDYMGGPEDNPLRASELYILGRLYEALAVESPPPPTQCSAEMSGKVAAFCVLHELFHLLGYFQRLVIAGVFCRLQVRELAQEPGRVVFEISLLGADGEQLPTATVAAGDLPPVAWYWIHDQDPYRYPPGPCIPPGVVESDWQRARRLGQEALMSATGDNQIRQVAAGHGPRSGEVSRAKPPAGKESVLEAAARAEEHSR